LPITHPRDVHDTFMAALNAKDVERLLAVYDTSGIAVQLDGGECTGAMRAMLAGLAGTIGGIRGTTRKVFVVGDIALTSGTWTANVTLPDGSVTTQHGTTAEVSRRQPDGTWRVLIDDPAFV
jgi:uncharacterized protein (TIGR02246 family)